MSDPAQGETKKRTGKQPTNTAKPTNGTAAAAPTKRARAPKASEPRMPSYDEIAMRARLLFERSGHAPGRDEEFWLEAERQLRSELNS